MNACRRRRPSQFFGMKVLALAIGAVSGLTGTSRDAIEKLMEEAGLGNAGPRQRFTWLARGLADLAQGCLRRCAGRAFDRWVGEYRCDGLRFQIPTELTTLETRSEFLLNSYEIPERRLVRRYIPSDATVLELGGCLGILACLVNRRLADPRRHVVFEAHPLVVPYLEANRSRNGCEFQVCQKIVSKADPVAFYLRDPFIGGSSMVRTSGRRIDVPTTTVAEVERQTGFSFDTLVVDIEGGEYAFFAENRELLGRARLVIAELHPGIIGEAACQEIRDLWAAAGLTRLDRRGSVEAWSRTVV